MYNLILGSDLEAGAYSVKIDENGQVIDLSSGQPLCQIAPWNFVEPVVEPEPEPEPEPVEVGLEEGLEGYDMEVLVEEEMVLETELEVPDEESGTEEGPVEDVGGGGSELGEDDAGGYSEPESGDIPVTTPGPQGEHDSLDEDES